MSAWPFEFKKGTRYSATTFAEETALAAKKKEWTDGAAVRAWDALRKDRYHEILREEEEKPTYGT